MDNQVEVSYQTIEVTVTTDGSTEVQTVTMNTESNFDVVQVLQQGPKGEPGPQGPQGEKGDKGDQGDVGPAGPQGLPGPQGEKGLQGDRGPIGLTGPQGAQGEQGPKGDTGAVGPQGPIGATGPKGDKGDRGAQGPAGPQGEQGIPGPKGDTGLQGPQGDPGPQGPIGLTGAQGIQGPKGDTGERGPMGPAGPQGPIGLTGAKGDKGDKGDTGPQGPIGLTGATGPQGPQGAQGIQGDRGPMGPQGIQGEQGPIGATGPKGDKGDTGAQGPMGATGSQGPQGIQGLKGDKGDRGPMGPQGIQGEPGESIEYLGEYNAITIYRYNDSVRYGDSVYVYTYYMATAGISPESTTHWKLLISDGDPATNLIQSVNGYQGAVVLNTDDVAEGVTNKYYTSDRFAADFASKTTTNLTEGDNLYYTQARFNSAFSAKTTADLAESINLYWTNERFDVRFASSFAAKSTSDLAEGSNLYYTQTRFDDAFAAKTTTNLTEGTNLYWTDSRFDTRFALKLATVTPADIGASPAGHNHDSDYIKISTKNQVDGVAGLDSSGKLLPDVIPSMAISETYVVASEAEMVALNAQIGDFAKRTDLGKSFILQSNDPTLAANWIKVDDTTAGIQTVNGKGGSTVTLTAADVSALPNTGGSVTGDVGVSGTVTATSFIGDGSQLTGVNGGVTSVNTKTGDVILAAADIDPDIALVDAANVFTAPQTLVRGATGVTTIGTRLPGDTTNQFQVLTEGKLEWGAGGTAAVDTNLYRSAANWLRTDDSLSVNGNLLLGTLTDSGWRLRVYGSSYTDANAIVNGSVGIGTNSPDAKLEVNDTLSQIAFGTAADQAFLTGQSGWAMLSAGGTYNGANHVARTTGVASVQAVGSSGSIRFYLDSGLTVGTTYTPTELARFTSTGLGIGTVSPAAKLDVNGTARMTSFGNPTSGAGLELLYNSGTGVAFIQPYDRTAGVYKSLSLSAADITLNASGATKFTASTWNTSATTLQVTGYNAVTSGAGIEMYYNGGAGTIQTYNRTGAAFTPLNLSASALTFQQSNITKLSVGAHNTSTTTLQVTGVSAPATGAGVEVAYASGAGYILAYDRAGGTGYKPLYIEGNSVVLRNGSTDKLTIGSTINASTIVQVTGEAAPASGAGAEIGYSTGVTAGYLQVYDRTAGAYRDLQVKGSTVSIRANNTQQALASVSGFYTSRALHHAITVLIANTLTIDETHHVVVSNPSASGAVTVTLPLTPNAGRIVIIKDGKGDSETNNITIDGNGKNIDGAASLVIDVNYASYTLIYNGTQWNII